jgi:hypothetical protein
VERCTACDKSIRPHRPMIVLVLSSPSAITQPYPDGRVIPGRWHWSCAPPELLAFLPPGGEANGDADEA